MNLGTSLWTVFLAILALAIPAFATLRTVQAYRDSESPYEHFGSLAYVGLLFLALTALAAWICIAFLILAILRGDGAGLGALVVLFLLIVPYAA
jgi:hypothetical protein